MDENIVRKNIALFEDGLLPNEDGRKAWSRYSSFDYCFNYFQGFKNKKDISNIINIQNSCLHLAFYLASWGMLRASSFLLQKSIKFYEPLIKYISEKEDSFWKIDVPNYPDNMEILIECRNDIRKIINDNSQKIASDTLITKIMLGIFGNVSAYDTYFKNGSNLKTFNKQSLHEIKYFYDNYSEIISEEASKLRAFEYDTGKSTGHVYTKAKIIDMIFFIEGYKNSKK